MAALGFAVQAGFRLYTRLERSEFLVHIRAPSFFPRSRKTHTESRPVHGVHQRPSGAQKTTAGGQHTWSCPAQLGVWHRARALGSPPRWHTGREVAFAEDRGPHEKRVSSPRALSFRFCKTGPRMVNSLPAMLLLTSSKRGPSSVWLPFLSVSPFLPPFILLHKGYCGIYLHE